ncbi:hypothetical protein CUMW_232940 [Citrus unshiu]|uniref:Uncharacterized protein n=1 Tax=Citrus unshiu TaxID=55188 RepID=A0A2H5QIC9_CITUN|nr:hypothetical protein CUMW_232940 [Citrus unshiu]
MIRMRYRPLGPSEYTQRLWVVCLGAFVPWGLDYACTDMMRYEMEIAGTPDRPSDCKYILSLGHVMVLEDINVFVRTSWLSRPVGIV